MSFLNASINTGALVRRSIFFVILIALSFANLFLFFRGLNSQHAMDQAQIGREIARGNGFTTKFIRPIDYYIRKNNQTKEDIPIVGVKDTYNSPIYPFINAVVFKSIKADDSNNWKILGDNRIYPLDRVVVTISTFCFILSMGVTYLLICRIFDQKIAGVTVLIMLFCNVFWEFSLSGLPQMFMLLVFTIGLYFSCVAIENEVNEKPVYFSILIAALFFTLLALTHYLAIWISLGFVLYAALLFRPRGFVGMLALIVIILPLSFIVYRNESITGNLFGIAFLNLYNGIGGNIEGLVMRSQGLDDYPLIGSSLVMNLVGTIMAQFSNIIPLLGGIVVAPVFFLTLLHTFQRPVLSSFRWLIFTCFMFAALGLSIYGAGDDKLDPNQILIVFAPVMVAYALAYISTVWAKMPIVKNEPTLKNAHFIIVVVLCALPLALSLPDKVKLGLHSGKDGVPNWPPYYAPALSVGLAHQLKESEICFSDQPWAVAWYADRTSVWLPVELDSFEYIEGIANKQNNPFAGILMSPTSQNLASASEITKNYKDFTPLAINGQIIKATYPNSISPFFSNEKLKKISPRYSFMLPLVGYDMIYYSSRELTQNQ